MIRRPPRSTQSRSSAASDVYKRQAFDEPPVDFQRVQREQAQATQGRVAHAEIVHGDAVSYTHLRAHETVLDLVCRLLLEKKKKNHVYKI
mgnify:CR=1 FL=1